MGSRTIHVAAPFTLNLGPKGKVDVAAGVQVVDDEVADHWYTQAFLAHGGLGSVDYAEAAWGEVNKAFTTAQAAIQTYERLLAASVEADEAAKVEPREPPHLAHAASEYAARIAQAAARQSEPEAVDDDEPTGDDDTETGGDRGGDDGEEAPDDPDDGDSEGGGEGEGGSDDEGGAEGEGDGEETERSALDHDGNGGDGGSVALTSDKPFDEMTDEELRAFITERDGKAPHHRAGREKLLKLARKEDGDEA